MEQIIECNNLTHYYGKRLIYENLSFTVPKGRILGLLGKNGTGKTTTINILSGYLKPRSGECRIFGQEIQTMAPALRRNIGLLIEGHCDQRGTEEYNRALGERRANAIRAYLAGKGVPDERMKTISYGEDKPAVQGSGESVWRQNRRGVPVPMRIPRR